jgi:hypothetical protein
MATKDSEKASKAAEEETPRYCTLINMPPNPLPAEVTGQRSRMILLVRTKWANGTKLKYYFYNGASDGSPSAWKGTEAQKNVVKQAFTTWKNVGIGLEFEETTDKNEAEVRIGFQKGDGSWSYVGRDVIDAAPSPAPEAFRRRTWNL